MRQDSRLRRFAAYLLFALVLGCSGESEVSDRLLQAARSAPVGSRFDMKDFADFEWEAFAVLPPYTTREYADQILGFSWPEVDRYDLGEHDSFLLLVFVDGQSVVRAEKHPRCSPDFAPEAVARLIPREAAQFSVSAESGCAVARPAA